MLECTSLGAAGSPHGCAARSPATHVSELPLKPMPADLRAQTGVRRALLEKPSPSAAAGGCDGHHRATCATILRRRPPRHGTRAPGGQDRCVCATPPRPKAAVPVGHHVATILRDAYLRAGPVATAVASGRCTKG